MRDWLHYAWNDNVWSKVIAGVIVAIIIAVFKKPRSFIVGLFKPKLEKVGSWTTFETTANNGFDAKEYWARKNCVLERFPALSHGAKEALQIFGLLGKSTAQNVTDRLSKYGFPDARSVIDNLRNDSVPFIVSAGLSEYELNPVLAQIIKETVREEEKRLIDEVHPMSADAFKNRINNDRGYAARYNSISDRRKPINSYNKLTAKS